MTQVNDTINHHSGKDLNYEVYAKLKTIKNQVIRIFSCTHLKTNAKRSVLHGEMTKERQ